MKLHVKNKDIVWGYIAQFFVVASGVLLLPILLMKLDNFELAMWYLFQSISLLVYKLNFGFEPTFARNISFVFSGAKNINKTGFDVLQDKQVIDYQLLKNIISTMKLLYSFIGITAAILLTSVGTYYITVVVKNDVSITLLSSWIIYALSCACELFFYYYSSLLVGSGNVLKNYRLQILQRLIFLVLSVIGLTLGYGLLSIAISRLTSIIISRFYAHYAFYTEQIKIELSAYKTEFSKITGLLEKFWYNSWRIGVTVLSEYVILQFPLLIGAKYLEIKTVAEFGLTVQIFSIIIGIALSMMNSYSPLFANAFFNDDKNKLRKYFGLALVAGIVIFVSGSAFVILFGNFLTNLIADDKSFMPSTFTALYAVTMFIFVYYRFFLRFYLNSNNIPHLKASVFTAILTISLLFCGFSCGLGETTILLSVAIPIGIYNLWKWPFYVTRKIDSTVSSIVILGCSAYYTKLKQALIHV